MLKIPTFQKTNSSETNNVEDILILDIGTEFIKSSIFSINENGDITHLGSSIKNTNQTNAALLNKEDVTVISELTLNSLEECLLATNAKPQKVVVGIPSIHISSQTTTIRIKRAKPEEKITKKEIEEITTKLTDKAEKEAIEYFKSKNENFDQSIERLNSDITFVKIDGYITKELEGFRGGTLEISFFTSFAPSTYIESIVEITKKMKLQLITIVSNIYAVNKTISNSQDKNHLIIDIGGKNTDIAVIFGGEIIKIVNFNLGLQHFISYISKVTHQEKSVIFKNMQQNNVTEFKHIKYDIEKIWLSTLVSSLDSIDGVKVFPSEVILTGGGKDYVSKELLKESLTQLKFKEDVEIINYENTEILDKTEDPKLLNSYAICVFAKKLIL